MPEMNAKQRAMLHMIDLIGRKGYGAVQQNMPPTTFPAGAQVPQFMDRNLPDNPYQNAPIPGTPAGGGLWDQLKGMVTPDFTPSPERQAEMQKQIQRRMAEEAMKRKAQEEAMRRYIDESMRQPATGAAVGGNPGGGSVIDRTEGGNPVMDQMSPAIIDALRRSGAM